MPHTNPSADLATLAAWMVSSGQFTSAKVTPGGITAKLSSGAPAVVFADRLGTASHAASAIGRAPNQASQKRATSLSTASDVVAILVNNTDTTAFHPSNQYIMANAVQNAGFDTSTLGVTNGDVSLDTIASLTSSGNMVDYFDISTHGMVAVNPLTSQPFLIMLSDSPVTGSVLSKYASDYVAGNLQYAVTLTNGQSGTTPQMAFTMGFITSHVNFQVGAIFVSYACYGQNSAVAGAVQATLQAAHVGRYIGWDNPVGADESDQTDAFIFDRLIGEASTALGVFVPQRSPAQRPFPLDDIQGALYSETRSGPFLTSALNYGQSPADPTGRYPTVNLVVSNFGGQTLGTGIEEYALPSIENVTVNEDPVTPTLTINGSFPAQPGMAGIIDPSTSVGTPVAPISWNKHTNRHPDFRHGQRIQGQRLRRQRQGHSK